MGEHPSTHTPVTYESCAHIEGPFYHGTKSALEAGAGSRERGAHLPPPRLSAVEPGFCRGRSTTLQLLAAWLEPTGISRSAG